MRYSLTVFRCGYLLVVAFVLFTLWKPLNEAATAVEGLDYGAHVFESSTSVTPQGVKQQSVSENRFSSAASGSNVSSTQSSPNARADSPQTNVGSVKAKTPSSDGTISKVKRIDFTSRDIIYADVSRSHAILTTRGDKPDPPEEMVALIPSTALKPATSSQQGKKKKERVVATFDGQTYTKASMDAFVESLSTEFSVWNTSTPYAWCHSNKSMNDGILYVKLPTCGSSTASGVALRVADTLGRRMLGYRQKCHTRYTHAIASHNLRQYGSRNPTTSFLWSIVRSPNQRLLSSYFFDQVSRQHETPTEEGIISYLENRSELKKSYMLRYLKLVRIKERETTLINEIMRNYNFIGLADRMDESLVVMSIIMQVPLTDVVLLSSKTSGGYDAGRSNKGCVRLVPKIKFTGVEQFFNLKEWRNNNWDQLFVQVVNRTLDKTIASFGRELVDEKVKDFHRLSEKVYGRCISKAIFPCPETLPNHAQLSDKSCYFADSGCGYKCIDQMLHNSSEAQWLQIQNKLGGFGSTSMSSKQPIPPIEGESLSVAATSAGISLHSNRTTYPTLSHGSTKKPRWTQQSASPLPKWFDTYLQFHRNSIADGKIKDGVPFLVYQCHGGCAGLGGRIKAMVKSFYAAVCSRRVFLIDSPFPFPLDEYLAPNMIEWNASFLTNASVEVPIFVRKGFEKNNLTIPLHSQIGVRIAKAHGKKILDMNQILRTQMCRAYSSDPNVGRLRSNEQEIYKWGSQILFQFSDQVSSRADTLRLEAGLSASIPYVGLHLRTGEGATWKEDSDRLRQARKDGHDVFVQCFRLFHDVHGFSQGYVAADSDEPRLALHGDDVRLKIAKVETFHIDRSLSKNATNDIKDFRGTFENKGGLLASLATAQLGTLDLFAELKILVDSECLIMSRSSLSYVAHFMSAHQPHCGMLVDDCSKATVMQRSVNYRLIVNMFKIDM